MPTPRGVITVSAHLPAEDAHLLDTLRDRAHAADRSLSAEIRRALRFALENDNGSAANAPAAKAGSMGSTRHAV